MENTGTVCTHVAKTTPSPRSNNHGRGQPQEGAAIKDNVIIVENVGIWPMCALLNIKLQQKRTKRKRETLQSIILLLTCYFLLIVLLILI